MRHTFTDNLMAAVFTLCIDAPESETPLLRAAAEEYFDYIRLLESLLSRFIEDSDIARINRMQKNETLVIAPETYRCLAAAEEAKRISGGYFDIAYRTPQTDFTLLTKPHRIYTSSGGLQLDLGGIGKGFALDRAASVLQHYGCERALLCASTSTVLALQPPENAPGWAVSPPASLPLYLAGEAISCSGKSVKGEHIFNPKTQTYRTANEQIWIREKTAALADALSTAALAKTEAGYAPASLSAKK
ncbi:MAG: FAD:protein FMN transferase [Planctomycetaceae bacterium]|nr:FAD:protein FMN transferase [Planctomycetaceae bacterium]